MFRTGVLTLLWLFVRLVHSSSWDIVVGEDKRLDFYYNGALTHTEDIPSSHYIHSVTYDPVHYRVLFADYIHPNVAISSFDLLTRKIQPIVTSNSIGYYVRVVYDPVTQLLFWRQNTNIYSFSLSPASSNKAVDRNLLLTLDHACLDIAVDSCRGYIYWVTDYEIERARFDGSEREILIASKIYYRASLAIDQQTQKIYWTETKREYRDYELSIESADFDGKNRTTFHLIERNRTLGYSLTVGNSLTVSKDFIYWKNWDQVGIWQLPKIPSQHVDGKVFSKSRLDCPSCNTIAANYAIKDQTREIKSCEAFKSLIPNASMPESTVSICQNYCFQGDCSVSAEGQPTCSCKAGYSGQRCEVNACYKHCLNNGVCFLNKDDEAVCECPADYEGVRCDVATTCTGVHADNTTPQVLRDLYSAVKQVVKEELKHSMQFYSAKIDKNEAQIQKCEKSIADIKNLTGLQYHDETTPNTQTSN